MTMNNEQHDELEAPSLELDPMAGTVNAPTVTNGITERLHSSLGSAFKGKKFSNVADFKAELHQVAWSQPLKVHRILDVSPSELVFGCHMLDPTLQASRTPLLKQALKIRKNRIELIREETILKE